MARIGSKTKTSKPRVFLVHTSDVRPSQVLYELTCWRDANGEPQLTLFGQLKRIVKQWLDEKCLVCKGGTYPAQLKYKMLADMACERIMAAITRESVGKRPIKASLDPYTRLAPPPMSASIRRRWSAGKRMNVVATSIGSCWIAIGKPSSAASQNLTRAFARTSKITISGWKCHIATARISADTALTSSSWSTTVVKPHGDLITAVLFDVDEGQERERIGADDAFVLDITLLHAVEPDHERAALAAQAAKEDIQNSFATKLFDKKLNKWRSIELRYVDAVSEEALTYRQFTLMKPWRLEYVSLGADPPQPIIAD